MKKLVEFKKNAAITLIGGNDVILIFLVAVKYSGDISILNSSDLNMINVVPTLTGESNPYHLWCLFSTQKEAEDYEQQLKGIDISPFIPKDPMEVKAAR